MRADRFAVDVDYAPFDFGQVAREEFGETPLADETDAGAVLLVVDRQASLPGHSSYFALVHFAERKQALLELLARNGLEEIALVLVLVHAFQQLELAVRMHCAHIVAGSDHVRPQQPGVVQKKVELDLPVAEHVGIRCAPGGILGKKASEDTVPVFGGEIRLVQRDLET